MSFNAKNLSYESKEPTFLRKLKSEFGGHSDRHERPLARPRKQKDGDEDDEPTYVDEESNDTISKAEYAAMLSAGNKSAPPTETAKVRSVSVKSMEDTEDGKALEEEELPKKEAIAVIGSSGKRRIAKVIGDEDDAKDGSKRAVSPQKVKEGVPKSGKKATKKVKKIKLAFEDETIEA